MKKFLLFACLGATLFLPGCKGEVEEFSFFAELPRVEAGSPFTDPRDGQVYQTVVINDQTWMVDHLAFPITGSECLPTDPDCNDYGRIYTNSQARNACPAGWSLPTDTQWKSFMQALLGIPVAEGDESVVRFDYVLKQNFNITYTGYRSGVTNRYLRQDTTAFYWTRSVSASQGDYVYFTKSNKTMISTTATSHKFSCLCIKE
jgi:uncharacterized protein (TIGR02145 family)